jgi:hypothetical protein
VAVKLNSEYAEYDQKEEKTKPSQEVSVELHHLKIIQEDINM